LVTILAATIDQPKKIGRRFFGDVSVASISVKPGSMCGHGEASYS
jgi:hypothetical protein